MKDLHPVAKGVIASIALIVVLNLVVGGIDRASGGRRPGERASSYTTAPDGLAAYASLLERNGHHVTQLRHALDETELPPDAALLVMEGAPSPEETKAVRAFVAGGGKLVASGPSTGAWLPQVLPSPPLWSPAAVTDAALIGPVDEVADVGTVRSPGAGAWEHTGSGLPVLGGAGGMLLAIHVHAGGRIAALATSAPLFNANLEDADNAALGLGLVRGTDHVLFAESVHGHVDGRGLGALPAEARWAFGLLAVAACVWLVVRGRRLGPPERADRDLAPPRRLYVEALAATLRRTKRSREALAGVQLAAQRRLAQRAGLRRGASPDEIRSAAQRFGLDAREVEAILTGVTDEGDVLAAGRALAKLETR